MLPRPWWLTVATAVLTVTDPPREYPWLVSAALTALRGDDAVVSMPALRLLTPDTGAVPLTSDDTDGLRRVASEAIARARLDGVHVEVSFDGE